MLTAGSRLGSYEIVSVLGTGGMGHVYRARDPRLGRDVAIKVLPASVMSDPVGQDRFRREAQVLAALNHPNIATIYGLEDDGEHVAIAMELVEGPTLAELIARGPLAVRDALTIARQLTTALEFAHDRGIIHRDLKPANIKVPAGGLVKVLDFGIAKVLGSAASTHGENISPTFETQTGTIVGTPRYMSPEQLRGAVVDQRADIWAFGCVLYEMMTGVGAFDGGTSPDILAAILHHDPDWTKLPDATPRGLRRVLSRCLKKDPTQRIRAIADVGLEIDDVLADDADGRDRITAPVPRRRTALVGIGALGLGALAGAAAIWALLPEPGARSRPVRFEIATDTSQPFLMTGAARDLAVSPDGSRLAYVSTTGQLLVRSLDQLSAAPIPGITGADTPFFSPDGRWIGFFTGLTGELKKVSVAGGPAVLLCRYQGQSRGASWGPHDTVVFATNDPSSGLLSVSALGGEPKVITTPDRAHGESDHLFPSLLPDGRAVLFAVTSADPRGNTQVSVLDLEGGRRVMLIPRGSSPEFVDDRVIFLDEGALHAVRFDRSRLATTGDSVAIVPQVLSTASEAAQFDLTRDGGLIYVPGGRLTILRSLTWVDRDGSEEAIPSDPRAYQYPRLSPDGSRVALDIRDEENDIWVWSFAEQTLKKLTIDRALDQYPVWTPDSRTVIFASTRAGTPNLFSQSADNSGTAERLIDSPNNQYPTSISPDGAQLIFRENHPISNSDVMVLDRGGRTAHKLVQTPAAEDNGELSPDGRWLAYQSNESGDNQIFVRPFPGVEGGYWQVSTTGGSKPLWARSGRELFYIRRDGAVMVVSVQTGSAFSHGTPTKLLDPKYFVTAAGRTYDVAPDGKRLLMIKNVPNEGSPPPIAVVLNWMEELKAALPGK